VTEHLQPEPVEPPPPLAVALFGDRLEQATRYVGWLAGTGIEHGLIGPRELPRLWDRHLLNCAVVAELLPDGSEVLDLGSGAGLPGLVLAIARPDLSLLLVEPLLRRVTWLQTVVQDLDLANVRVLRGRAEDVVGQVRVPFVTARAVAPLERLARWSLPLLDPGGVLLAMKGGSADEELERDAMAVARAGGIDLAVLRVGMGLLDPPGRVIRVRRGPSVGGAPATKDRTARRARPAANRTAGPSSTRSRGGRT
jgi:16S rRNA (guanine527-N7)-methyltransferase